MILEEIQSLIRKGDYRFSDHAVKMMIKRDIERIEVEEAILAGKIIEEYPNDKYSPTCLVFGEAQSKRILHVHVSLPPAVVIITVYEPDESEWREGRLRRRKT